MSIKKTIEFKGITVVDAHITAVMPAIAMGNRMMTFGVQYRSSPEAEVFQSEIKEAPYDIDGGNPLEQAYAHLKTLPGFIGAVDC
ncbi:hypothetical protein [Pseudomonas sp. PDM30]|uniref:hypothetical protein n=1 Tax=Pseudomonas sp. PDM30 TaxID=2854773 RepID=UPI001C4427FA|nr:hypothetical protein [Pseudomonas sp. PDM30]MBV7489855.1 hypothetical protein [Pseudomonas sp. PDM30]